MSGFDRRRLDRIETHLQAEIDARRLAVVSLDLWRHDALAYSLRLGSATAALDGPAPDDATRFRWHSLTKPLTALTLLTFYEEGRFSLDTPIARFLPEMADMRVEDEDGVQRPASRPIQMRDLFGHRAGFAYGLHPDMHPLERRYAALPVLDFSRSLMTLVERAAALPLASDPGSDYRYSIAVDLMAAIVERLSGQLFGQVLAERLLDPLGMAHTNFRAAPDELPPLMRRSAAGAFEPLTQGPLVWDTTDPALESGGAGLIGTIGDAGRWLRMVLRGLEGGADTPLSPAILRMATEPFQRMAADPGWTLDLTMAGFTRYVTPAFSGTPVSPRGLTVAGAANTFGLIDPDHSLVAVLMTQLVTDDWGDSPSYALEPLIYQALT